MLQFSALPLTLLSPACLAVLCLFPLFFLWVIFLPLPLFARSLSSLEGGKPAFLTVYCLQVLLWVHLFLLWARLALLRMCLLLSTSKANLLFLVSFIIFLPSVWFVHSYLGPCVCYLDLMPLFKI